MRNDRRYNIWQKNFATSQNIVGGGNLKAVEATLTDTIQANQTTSAGVLISTLTNNKITSSQQIKGISWFNQYPEFIQLLQYQEKLVVGRVTGAGAAAKTYDVPLIIYY